MGTRLGILELNPVEMALLLASIALITTLAVIY